MLSVSTPKSSQAIQAYFEKDDYYLKGAETSQWVGSGAESLGLSGPVSKEDFKALTEGYSPSGDQLVKPKITKDKETGEKIEEHRAGNDLTFSAPKSVSIAYAAGVPGMKEAHDAAMDAMCSYLEKYYSHARTPEGFASGSLVAAKFDHATSRAVDPQLHSHLFGLNVTQTEDGQWRANEPINIFKDQKVLGALYRQVLANQLMKMGYEIRWTDREQNLFELKAVPQNVIATFSQRREEIEAKVEKWKESGKYDQLKGKGLTDAQIWEKATLATRAAKDKNLTKEMVSEIWEKVFASLGLSSKSFEQSVSGSRLETPALAPADERAESIIKIAEQAVSFHNNKEAVIDLAQVIKTCCQLSAGQHSLREIVAAVQASAIELGDVARNQGRVKYTTPEMIQIEQNNKTMAESLGGTFKSITSKEEVEQYLDHLKATEHIDLSKGQRDMVVQELTNGNGLNVANGDPGTGKTYALGIITRFDKEVLLPSGREHVVWNVGFTGRAAAEMAAKTGGESYTTDSFLNRLESGKIKLGEQKDGVRRQEVIRVDEASYESARQINHLLRVVKDAQGNGATIKMSLQGDLKQRLSIAAGRAFQQMKEITHKFGAYIEMKEIIRQSIASGLRPVATKLNDTSLPIAQRTLEALGMIENQNRIVEIKDRAGLVKATVAEYLNYSQMDNPDKPGQKATSIVVCTTNAEVQELNKAIRQELVASGKLEEGSKFKVYNTASVNVMASSYRTGQKVMFSGYRDDDTRKQTQFRNIPLNTPGLVKEINAEKNMVTIQYEMTGRGGSKIVAEEFSAADLALNVSVYNLNEKLFAVGDRVMNLLNGRFRNGEIIPTTDKQAHEVKNGDIGTIKAVNDGVATILFNEGESSQRTVKMALSRAHIDHAYAATDAKLQGATLDFGVIFAAIKEGVKSMLSYQGENVALTRFRHDLKLLTNSLKGLKDEIKTELKKTSTLDYKENQMVWPEKARAAEKGTEKELPPGVAEAAEVEAAAASIGNDVAEVARENHIFEQSIEHQEAALEKILKEVERLENLDEQISAAVEPQQAEPAAAGKAEPPEKSQPDAAIDSVSSAEVKDHAGATGPTEPPGPGVEEPGRQYTDKQADPPQTVAVPEQTAERVINAMPDFSGEAGRWTGVGERFGHRASAAPLDFFTHQGRDGHEYSIKYAGDFGFSTSTRSTVDTALSKRSTEIIRGDHGKTVKTTHSRGDWISRSSESSGAVHRHKTRDEQGNVIQAETVRFSERSQQLFGGLYRSSTRTERLHDGSKRLIKSTSWGNKVKGTTTTYHKDGRIVETEWTGTRRENGDLQINESTTKTKFDASKTKMETGNFLDIGVRAIIQTITFLKDPNEYRDLRNQLTRDHALKITTQRYQQNGSVLGKTEIFTKSQLRADKAWARSTDKSMSCLTREYDADTKVFKIANFVRDPEGNASGTAKYITEAGRVDKTTDWQKFANDAMKGHTQHFDGVGKLTKDTTWEKDAAGEMKGDTKHFVREDYNGDKLTVNYATKESEWMKNTDNAMKGETKHLNEDGAATKTSSWEKDADDNMSGKTQHFAENGELNKETAWAKDDTEMAGETRRYANDELRSFSAWTRDLGEDGKFEVDFSESYLPGFFKDAEENAGKEVRPEPDKTAALETPEQSHEQTHEIDQDQPEPPPLAEIDNEVAAAADIVSSPEIPPAEGVAVDKDFAQVEAPGNDLEDENEHDLDEQHTTENLSLQESELEIDGNSQETVTLSIPEAIDAALDTIAHIQAEILTGEIGQLTEEIAQSAEAGMAKLLEEAIEKLNTEISSNQAQATLSDVADKLGPEVQQAEQQHEQHEARERDVEREMDFEI
ncbi:relaxase domain-containing protein [Oryzomonas sagensis]|uniref:Relaxase domain-containing protein n=1 Tax=Oryzomonas sagensis TaxID=2603857 RepID=A0ABQ6TL99_9BACT|nr:MobF family relaxase [Oryzomonas sagensis]KAB0669015.1 relaxase domain-containing protein [Oryzomonas sagensis]